MVGKWVNIAPQGYGDIWELQDLTLDELEIEYQKALELCRAKRKEEYPEVADYLDAQAKNDIVGMQSWVDAQLAIKTKYPKPNRTDYGLV